MCGVRWSGLLRRVSAPAAAVGDRRWPAAVGLPLASLVSFVHPVRVACVRPQGETGRERARQQGEKAAAAGGGGSHLCKYRTQKQRKKGHRTLNMDGCLVSIFFGSGRIAYRIILRHTPRSGQGKGPPFPSHPPTSPHLYTTPNHHPPPPNSFIPPPMPRQPQSIPVPPLYIITCPPPAARWPTPR